VARLPVVSDHDPDLRVELAVDDDARWRGTCIRCPDWSLTLRESYSLDDSHAEAEIHIDYGHPTT